MNANNFNSKRHETEHVYIPPALNEISEKIVHAAFKVHSTLGPGMFESVYEICLKILPVHKAQLLTYLKLYNRRLGLLINFNVPLIRDGIQRFVN